MDITQGIERFCEVLGQALASEKGDNYLYLTKEKYSRCLNKVKAAKIVSIKQ
jgi:hypothetical protein